MRFIRGASAVLASLVLACAAPAVRAAVLTLSFGADDAAQREGFKALVNDFRAANPDVEVHLTLTDAASYRKTLPASLDGDAAPDVFNWLAGEPLRELAQRGELDDLSDLWKANTWWNTFPSGPVSVGGRQYAVPYQVYPWGLFMRHDVLDRAGIHEPPRDLGALLTDCARLRRAGFVPIALGARDAAKVAAWFDFIDLRANGFDFHQQLLAGKVSYDDASVRRSFLMWKQLIDAKCFEPTAPATDEAGAEALLYAGRAGMLLGGTVMSAGVPEIVRPQIDYARFPVIDSGLAPAEAAPIDAFQVAARARNKADARRFLKFASGATANGRLAKAFGSFPANKLAPVAGTVLDLSSYKVLADARANVVQGYERDTPPEMAREGLKGFQEFLAQPAQMYRILAHLDEVRAAAYAAAEPDDAAAAATAVTAAATKTKKR